MFLENLVKFFVIIKSLSSGLSSCNLYLNCSKFMLSHGFSFTKTWAAFTLS